MGVALLPHRCQPLARYPANIPADSVIQERRPAPRVAPRNRALGIYVDNVYSIGCQVRDSLWLVAGFVEESGCRSLWVHLECQDAEEATILGVEIWGRERLVRPSWRRLWRVHRSAQALLGRAEVHPTEVQVWVGHYFNLCQLFRPLLSVLETVYAWIVEAGDRRAPFFQIMISCRDQPCATMVAGRMCFRFQWLGIFSHVDSSDPARGV